MKKLENLNGSLFENFEDNKMSRQHLVLGTGTGRLKDCNPTRNVFGDEPSGWKDDSTTRSADGCND